MPKVDFKPDVDGFAFANDWTFDEIEKAEIRRIIENALPVAAAALTPILMAVSPAIAPAAGIALGPAMPLIGLGLPFLPFAAPKISELIITAIADKIAKGGGKDDLCGGMSAAALDYHRLGWLPPRGNGETDTPAFDPNHPTSVQSQLRRRIWQGQLESHLDNSPKVVLWKAVATLFGDWGHDWLRDRTRDELAKIAAELSAGRAVPLGLVWNFGDDFGHIVVVYALQWHGPNACSLTVYDNELPDRETLFDIDLAHSPALIIDRNNSRRQCDGVFLASFRQKAPAPAVVLSRPLTISPTGYAVRGEALDGDFSILNQGFGDLTDAMGALRSAGSVVAPVMPFQLPASLTPVAWGADEPVAVHTTSLPAGEYFFEPIVMAGSKLAGIRVPRTLPNADSSPAAVVTLRMNPAIPIKNPDAHSGFGCARMPVEGTPLNLEADLSWVTARGVQSVVWTVSGALTMTVNGPLLMIPALPASPAICDVRVVVTLSDGTEARGSMKVAGVSAAVADRAQRLCELAHLFSRVPLTRVPLDSLINPVRDRRIAVRGAAVPDPHLIVAEMRKALEQFGHAR